MISSDLSTKNLLMKDGIHPTIYPDAKVICSCGITFDIPMTIKEVHTDLCSACHPFYTGKQKLVDTAGRVDKFQLRMKKAEKHIDKPVKKERRKKILVFAEDEDPATIKNSFLDKKKEEKSVAKKARKAAAKEEKPTIKGSKIEEAKTASAETK